MRRRRHSNDEIAAADIAANAPAGSPVGIAGGTGTPSAPPESNPVGQPETARIEPSPEPTGPAPRPVTAETLADALPPKAAQANVDLPTATVGSDYRVELPTFADPGGKGLRLAASGLPDGLTFSDAGGGKGAIEGVPQQATNASIRIVATNLHDRTAQMTATLVVSGKPAPAPAAKLETPIAAPSQKPSHLPSLPNPRRRSAGRAGLHASPVRHRLFRPRRRLRVGQNAAPVAPSAGATPQTVAREETRPLNRPRLRRRAASSARRGRLGGGKGQGVHRAV